MARNPRDPLPPRPPDYDAVLVGGGLQNSLIALALLRARPAARIAMVEKDALLGGNHTWCFHAADVPDDAAAVLAPLVEFAWPGYEVRFHGFARQLDSPYAGFTSQRLHAVVAAALDRPGCRLLTRQAVVRVGAEQVELADGSSLQAPLVVDARGPEPAKSRGRAGYQKFLGRELRLSAAHGIERPLVMDATVPQRGGFRFFYVLPIAADRLLVEDTRFADRPELEPSELRAEIDGWLAARGLQVAEVLREEIGLLPMPWSGRGPLAVPAPGAGPLLGGDRGGWLHPATGYSLPVALRLATTLAAVPTGQPWRPAVAALVRSVRPQVRFAQLLNRLLFRWFLPEGRSDVFRRFYRLPEPSIRRFYALRTTFGDRLRLLGGRPPAGLSLRARLTVAERFT